MPLGFDEQELGAELLADPASRKAIDGCWRSVGAVALVRSLLTQRSALARAADGVLEPDEQELILRPEPMPIRGPSTIFPSSTRPNRS